MKKEQNELIKKYNPTHIVIILFSLFLAIGLLVGELYREKDYQLHSNAQFVEVEAEIVEFKEFESESMQYYATYFEYTSHEGKTYRGFWSNDIYSKEEAEAMLGSKIRLYYNDALGVRKTIEEVNATKSVEKPNHIVGGIIVAVLLSLAVNSLIKTILYIKSNKQKKNSRRSYQNEKWRN